jgi:hypothetical protein
MAWENIPKSAISMGDLSKQVVEKNYPTVYKQLIGEVEGDLKYLAKSKVLRAGLSAVATSPLSKSNPVGWVGSALAVGAGLVLDYYLQGDNGLVKPAVDSLLGSASSTSPILPKNPASSLSSQSMQRANDVSNPLQSAGGGLIDILKTNGENTNNILSAQAQITAEQLGFLNEQFNAHLLYSDMMVSSLSEIVENSSDFSKIDKWAESAQAREEFLMTSQSVSDLEGNVITNAHPEQLKAQSHANSTKFHSDTNNDNYDDQDLPRLGSLPIIPFFGVSSSFDKKIPISQNPFTAINL